MELHLVMDKSAIREARAMEDMKTAAGFKFDDDRFDSGGYSFDLLPDMKEYVLDFLDGEECELLGENHFRKFKHIWDTAPLPGDFEIQRHTASVDLHTDDVHRRCYFGLLVLECREKESSRYRRYYDNRNELRYYDQFGKKMTKRLGAGEMLVFNPRKPHELIYFGDYTAFALFTVVKKVAKKKG